MLNNSSQVGIQTSLDDNRCMSPIERGIKRRLWSLKSLKQSEQYADGNTQIHNVPNNGNTWRLSVDWWIVDFFEIQLIVPRPRLHFLCLFFLGLALTKVQIGREVSD